MKSIMKFAICLAITSLYFTTAMAQQRPPRPPRPDMDLDAPRPKPGKGNPDERMEKLQSTKIAFLSQKMDLTTKEAEKFWPIYNQFQNEVMDLAKERRAEKKNADEVSADQRINDQLETETKMLELKKKYTREFGKVISSEKVVRLFDAEKEFKQELVRRLQERRKGGKE